MSKDIFCNIIKNSDNFDDFWLKINKEQNKEVYYDWFAQLTYGCDPRCNEYNYILLKDFVEKYEILPYINSQEEQTYEHQQEDKIFEEQTYEHQQEDKITEQQTELPIHDDYEYWEQNKQWFDNYNSLKDFIEKNNRMPSRNIKNEEKLYGKWCANQRTMKQINKLTIEQIILLEQLNGWYWEQINPWINKYNALKKFIEKYNRIPRKYVKMENTYALWCERQRTNKKKNKLSNKRIKLLEQLDCWYWNQDEKWLNNYNIIKKFIEENNRLPSSSSNKQKERIYYAWCYTQRTNKKKNRISSERIKLLEQLNYWIWRP
jgi:hypothetical protein